MRASRADVFVSYSHVDSDFVRKKLIPFLQKHQFTYLVDFETFQGGAPSIEEMVACVERAKRTVVVLTPDYISGNWTTFESILAQTLDPAAKARRLVPVLLKDCHIPLRLRILHYRDFRASSYYPWDALRTDLL